MHRKIVQCGAGLLIALAFAMMLLPLYVREATLLGTFLGRPIQPEYQGTVLVVEGIVHMVEGLLLLQLHRLGWILAMVTTAFGILNGFLSGPHPIPMLTAVGVFLYLFYTRSVFLGPRPRTPADPVPADPKHGEPQDG